MSAGSDRSDTAPPGRGGPMFVTTRLRARWVRADDLAASQADCGDTAAMRWVGEGEPLSLETVERSIEVTLANHTRRGHGVPAVAFRDRGRVVGFGGLAHPAGQVLPQIRRAVLPGSWGCGYASEAVCGTLAYGRARFALGEISATGAPAHVAARQVLHKAGMRLDRVRPGDDASSTCVVTTRAQT
jgi:[ribosomal protein S5]-alanine N-acetyltransferase